MYSTTTSNKNPINDTIFHLISLESVNYIMNKNIETKQKSLVNNLITIKEIEELGQHLGERISNHLLNTANTMNKMEIDEVMKFLGRDVWIYLFGKQISKLQTNRKGKKKVKL